MGTHKYKVGTLVEFIESEDVNEDYWGVRLYIIGCIHDCNGSPMYALGANKSMELYNRDDERFFNREIIRTNADSVKCLNKKSRP